MVPRSLGQRWFSSSPLALAKKLTASRPPRQKPSGGGGDKQAIPGPPNAGQFGRLQFVDPSQRAAHKNTILKVNEFSQLRIDPGIRNAIDKHLLGHFEVRKPTPIQTIATKAIRSPKADLSKTANRGLQTYLIAAETGSGKTLSYLAPILSDLNENPATDQNGTDLSNANIVRSVVLVPTLELISQVGETLSKMQLNKDGLHLTHAVSGFGLDKSISKIRHRTDVLVTTPDRFLNLFKDPIAAKSALRYCQHLVVDEADTLMDQSFHESTTKAIGMLPNLRKLIFCTATVPRRFDKAIESMYPNAMRILAPSLHRIPNHVSFKMVDVSKHPYNNNKPLALEMALYAIYKDNTEPGLVKRVVVFVNKASSIEQIVDTLNAKGYQAVGTSGSITPKERMGLVHDFVNAATSVDESESKMLVLVTTDVLARGVDMQGVRNVILYDLPHSSTDLLHRAGRTGRLKKRGRVVVLVSNKERKPWVNGLEKIVKSGRPLT